MRLDVGILGCSGVGWTSSLPEAPRLQAHFGHLLTEAEHATEDGQSLHPES